MQPVWLLINQATKFEFVINLKAAKQIGLTIPPDVLARANQIDQVKKTRPEADQPQPFNLGPIRPLADSAETGIRQEREKMGWKTYFLSKIFSS